MFFALAIISMLGYALQSALMVRYARKMDGLSLAFYRNISFTITLLPLLAFAPISEIPKIADYWHMLAVSALAGGASLGLRFASYASIPVGVSSSFVSVATTTFLTILGWALFDEMLSVPALILICITLGGSLWLGLTKNHLPHLTNRVRTGFGLTLLGALTLTASKFLFADLSRSINPLVSSYAWEVAIGFMTLGIIGLRSLFFRKGLTRISMRTFFGILVTSFPTLIGTGAYALAVRSGPVGIVEAIGSSSILIISLLAWRWYGERLRLYQWMAMLLMLVGIVGLRFAE